MHDDGTTTNVDDHTTTNTDNYFKANRMRITIVNINQPIPRPKDYD